MTKYLICILTGIYLWMGMGLSVDSIVSSASAQTLKLDVAGEIESNLFVGMQPQVEGVSASDNLGTLFNYHNTNLIALTLTPKYGRYLQAKARIEINNVNFSQATTSADLENYNRLLPISVRLNELYIDFFGLLPWLDLRIGQQRIAWGTATIFNPTDNLNPYNLENPLDFQKRLGVPAITASIHFSDRIVLTLVNVAMYTPAVLPISIFREVTTIDTSALVPEGFTLGQINSTEQVDQPEFHVKNMQGAARLAFDLSGINLSASYAFSRLFIPVVTDIDIIDPGFDLQTRIVKPIATAQLAYPRVHIVGMDFSTSVGGVGVWAEAALFIPIDTYKAELSIRTNPDDPKSAVKINPLTGKELPTFDTFKSHVFFKITAGLDYTFPGGWYVNLQYLYGFFNEQNWDELHHYAILALRKPFFREKLLVQLSTGFELDATSTSGDNRDGKSLGMAFLVNPEIHYSPIDAAKIILGGIVTRGHKGTSFSLFQSLTQVYLRAQVNF